MALIACPECGRQGISDQAAACPACAYPLAPQAREPVGRGGRPQPVATVEQTGKRWKAMKVWAGLLFVGGLLVIFGNVRTPPSTAGIVFGVVVLLASFVLAVRAAIGAWWHHA